MSNLQRVALTAIPALAVLAGFTSANAEDFKTVEEFQAMPLAYPKFMVDNLWILISAALVFIMHLGFATLETGLTRQKNTVNIPVSNTHLTLPTILRV